MIVLDGPIGVGKSTLFGKLQDRFEGVPEVSFVEEPLADWVPMLEAYYRGAPLTFELQLFMAATFYLRTKEALTRDNPKVIVCDRFIDSGPEAFSPLLLAQEKISRSELQIINRVVRTYKQDLDLGPTLRFFMRADPETLMKRIQKRGRPMELDIPMGYLTHLGYSYKKWTTRLAEDEYRVVPAGENWVKPLITKYIEVMAGQQVIRGETEKVDPESVH